MMKQISSADNMNIKTEIQEAFRRQLSNRRSCSEWLLVPSTKVFDQLPISRFLSFK
jgi:hypothetical protein